MRAGDGATPAGPGLTKVRAAEPGHELYLLALCGDDTDVPLAPMGVMAGTDEAHLLAHRLDDAAAHPGAPGPGPRGPPALEEIGGAAGCGSTWSWRLTKPFRLHSRLRRRG